MTLNVEQIITIAVMSLWLLFPIGMFISVMRQQNDEIRPHYPKNTPYKKEDVIHVTAINTYTYDHDEEENDLNYKDYDYTKVSKRDPNKDPRRNPETHHHM